ncbi:MAG: peptidoglycan bridge formation glycyltransferase FemA/FemB family protein [Clostridia bacterium]|nr:peptidoglycan bridge formation glycyltransferase FemA/FemB family protein [Clostridia bacterium]MDD4375776.1 peptidoglycan bridge formation glycyltransferase FemA/FemB family protein [Clostridia bacterium]
MSILDKTNNEQVKRYCDFIENYRGASLMQSYNWADVKSEWESEYVYIEENDEIVMAMLLLIRKVALGVTILYSPRGPVGDITDLDKISKIMQEVDKVAKKYKAFVFKFDPEHIYDEKLEEEYKKRGFNILNKNTSKEELIQPRYNMILNIKNKTDEELLKGYSEKTRYNIRLSARKGVTVRYSRDIEDLKKFHDLYKIMSTREKIAWRDFNYFEKMLKAFDEKKLRIYIAEYAEEALAAAIAINYGGKMFYLYGASSNEKRNLMPTYLMQQEMIRWGLECKCDLYDFGGVYVLDKSNGLYKFKEGFCRQEGVTEFIGEINKVYNKTLYFMYTKTLPLAQTVRKRLKRMFGK